MYSGKPVVAAYRFPEVKHLKLLYGICLAKNPVLG